MNSEKNIMRIIRITIAGIFLTSALSAVPAVRMGLTAGIQYDAYGFSADFQKVNANNIAKAEADRRGETYSSGSSLNLASSFTALGYGNAASIFSDTSADKDLADASNGTANSTNLNIGVNFSVDIFPWLFVRSGLDVNTRLTGGTSEITRSEFNSYGAGVLSILNTGATTTTYGSTFNGGSTAAAGNSYCATGNAALNGVGCNTIYSAAVGLPAATTSAMDGNHFKIENTFKGSFIRIPLIVGLQLRPMEGLEIYGGMGPAFYTGSIAYNSLLTSTATFKQKALSQTAGSEDKESTLKFDASGIGLCYLLGARTEVADNVDVGIELQIDAFSKVSQILLGTTSDNTKAFDRSVAADLASVTKGTYLKGDTQNEAEAYFPVSFSGITVSFTAGYRFDVD